MATINNVRSDSTLLSRLDRALFSLETALVLGAGLFTLFVMFVAVANIVGRYFGYPVPGYVDYMEQAVPAIAILGIAYCQRTGAHIRMDILVGNLKGRTLWLFEFLSVLLMLAITAVLAYGAWDHTARALRNGDSTVDINLPTWPAKILFPILFAILALRLVLQTAAYARALRTGEEEPVAVPLVEDPAAQAKAEAQTVSGMENGVESQ